MEYEIKDVQKWGIDEARKKFISENKRLSDKCEIMLQQISNITEDNLNLSNIVLVYQEKILQLDDKLLENDHSLFERNSILIDLKLYFVNKITDILNRLYFLIPVLDKIQNMENLASSVYYNKALNIFLNNFGRLKEEIVNFEINNIAKIMVENFVNLENYSSYESGDFKANYEKKVLYLSNIGEKRAMENLALFVKPVVEKREQLINKKGD